MLVFQERTVVKLHCDYKYVNTSSGWPLSKLPGPGATVCFNFEYEPRFPLGYCSTYIFFLNTLEYVI